MAAGDINDALSNIPNIVVVDQSAATAAPGAGYARLEVVNGELGLRVDTGAWIPLLALGADAQLGALAEKATPVAADLLLLEDSEASSAKKRVPWSSLPGAGSGFTQGCRVRNTTDQNCVKNQQTVITFDTEDFDTDGMHESVTNPSRITIATTGKYLVVAQLDLAYVSANLFTMEIMLNGATTIASLSGVCAGAYAQRRNLSTLYSLTAGDYLTVAITHYQTSDANSVAAAPFSPVFGACRVG